MKEAAIEVGRKSVMLLASVGALAALLCLVNTRANVRAVGELFGGGMAPVLVGQVAKRFGIQQILWLPVVMIIVGILLCAAVQDLRARPPLVSNEAFT